MATRLLQWLSLVGIIWLQSINGTNFNFPAYSSQLKHLLTMSQLQLNNLAFASDAGKLLGWFSGIATVYLPLWLVLAIGSTLGLIGYGVQYLFITNQIPSPSYWQIFLLTVVAGNSICWINTVCYVVAIQNFPSHRQVAVGISTSYQGLSAKIYTDLVDVMVSFSRPTERAKAFLCLNSALPLLVSFVAAPLARDIDVESSRNMEGGFAVVFAITIMTGVYAIISSLKISEKELSSLSIMIGIGVLLLAPLAVPVGERIKEMGLKRQHSRGVGRVSNFTEEESAEDVERVENMGRIESGKKEEEEGGSTSPASEVGVIEEIGVKEMIQRINFWLYFFVYFFGPTIGLVFLNNLGQIAESRQCSDISSLVSLSSSFGFFGRLIPSFTDHFFSGSKHTISRSASVVAFMAPMGGAFFLLILSPTHLSLYTGTAIIGVCTGAIISVSVSLTTELFGTKNFSINHNVVVANIPIGSFLFGSMAAFLYPRHGHGGGKCIGSHCYNTTFVIWASLCFLATFLAFLLFFRIRKVYSETSLKCQPVSSMALVVYQ